MKKGLKYLFKTLRHLLILLKIIVVALPEKPRFKRIIYFKYDVIKSFEVMMDGMLHKITYEESVLFAKETVVPTKRLLIGKNYYAFRHGSLFVGVLSSELELCIKSEKRVEVFGLIYLVEQQSRISEKNFLVVKKRMKEGGWIILTI